MNEHNFKNKDEDKEPSAPVEIIHAAVSLRLLISTDFDYAAFADAINNEPTMNDEQKERVTKHFHPKTKISFVASDPGPSITSYIETGATSTPPVDLPESDKELSHSNETPLPADHDVSKMWQDVWQQTLVHYAAEATEYESVMTKKGHPILDDPMGYPARTPPITLDRETQGINAAAGLGENGKVSASVSKDFLTKLEPEDQRAILFHEAQHAFEPVLHKQTPRQHFKQDRKLSLATGNYYSRRQERRADSHAGKMGAGNDLQAALSKIEDNFTPEMEYRETVLGHLVRNGFSVDNQSLGNILEAVETKTTPDAEPPTSRVGILLNSAYERINDYLVNKHANGVNERLQQGAGIETPQPKIKTFASQVLETISTRISTHPETPSRLDALGKEEPCNGCADPSPFTSHGDRVKAISESGIQGIVR